MVLKEASRWTKTDFGGKNFERGTRALLISSIVRKFTRTVGIIQCMPVCFLGANITVHYGLFFNLQVDRMQMFRAQVPVRVDRPRSMRSLMLIKMRKQTRSLVLIMTRMQTRS
ncbi:UNVERIFIED_CONTAM: hypothetical protein Slati_1740800 [Sesamum latifolium]|uniref:Uncharacterized protein n=1 Tax=Sesamum latifolium TaxID=2727402 RepID=A0AAW2WYW2_9LAMI